MDIKAERKYVYEDKEIQLTGRAAVKKERGKDVVRVEIRPLNASPDNNEYNRWVSAKDLFIIVSDDENDILDMIKDDE